jgi:hypothetical protein
LALPLGIALLAAVTLPGQEAPTPRPSRHRFLRHRPPRLARARVGGAGGIESRLARADCQNEVE